MSGLFDQASTTVGLVVVASLLACGAPHEQGRQSIAVEPPRQEVHLGTMSAGQREIQGALEKLAVDRRTIDNLMGSYQVSTRQVGPVFDSEVDVRKTDILQRCSDLEIALGDLESHPQLAEFSGAVAELEDLRGFLAQTRARLEEP